LKFSNEVKVKMLYTIVWANLCVWYYFVFMKISIVMLILELPWCSCLLLLFICLNILVWCTLQGISINLNRLLELIY